jgi:hypothetical protein
MFKKFLSTLAVLAAMLIPSMAQQPQANDVPPTQPIFATNAKMTNGVAPGYWPTANATGLTLNISPGTSFFNTTIAFYAGGTLTMTNSTTNYVSLNESTGNPQTSTSNFSSGQFPVAIVVASGGNITTVTDVRTMFTQGAGGGSGACVAATSPIQVNGGAGPICSGTATVSSLITTIPLWFTVYYGSNTIQPSASFVYAAGPIGGVGYSVVVPSGCAGTLGHTVPTTTATASTAFTYVVIHSGTPTVLCTLTWGAGQSVATITGSGGTLVSGDDWELVGAASPDATLANIDTVLSGSTN